MIVIYDGPNHHLKVFDQNGNQVFLCDARNDSVADNAWRPDAGCPPGDYQLAAPEYNDLDQTSTPDNDWVGEGRWFVPIIDIPGHDGIGIHGGGSCVVPHELDPQQGWCPTLNCIRLQNEDLEKFVDLVPNGGSSIKVVQSP